MKPLRRVWNRLAGAVLGWRREEELAAEIEGHLRMQTEDNLRLGMPPEEARRQAVLKFGGVEAAKESYRDQRGIPFLENLARDLRYAFRGLRREPGFAAAAVLSLALGIAAATAVFSVVNATLLRRLPYPGFDRLAMVGLADRDFKPARDTAVSVAIFEAFQREAGASLEQAALFDSIAAPFAGEGEPERIQGARISSSLFAVLKVQPRLGRAFTPEEDSPISGGVVLIGDGLWKRKFGADPGILGRKVVAQGLPFTIIGVMPPGFEFPNGPELPYVSDAPPAEFWLPMGFAPWERTCVTCLNFAMISRLRPGVRPERAEAQLSGIFGGFAEFKKDRLDLVVRTLDDILTRKTRTPLWILFGAVSVVLLISCMNVASLLIARGLRRRTEMAVRLSIGAARGRMVQQLLTEAFALSVCAAALAIPLAAAGVRVLVAIAPASAPGMEKAGLNAPVLAFALGVALLSTLLCGAAPAWAAARRDPGEVIKGGARTASAKGSPLRRALVVAEVALALVLVVASTLLGRSFAAAAGVALGFRPQNVLTMQLALPRTAASADERAKLVEVLVRNCAGLRGVMSAAAVNSLPLSGEGEGHGLIADGVTDPKRSDFVMTRYRAVTPDYFRTLGIRLTAGRDFTAQDRGDPPVAIVSATAARRLWPDAPNPVGMKLNEGSRKAATVVGVAEDTRASGLDQEVRPYVYVPFPHFATAAFALAVRTTGDPMRAFAAVRAEFRKIDKDEPITHVATLEGLVRNSVAPRRFQAAVMGSFGAFSLLLAAVGVFGVLSYSVAQRAHEIGIRMALGASRWRMVAEILREAALLTAAGAVLGLAAAIELTPLLKSLLYKVEPGEPWVFAASAALLAAVAAVACVIPARRAAKLDPAESLRCE